MNVGLWSVSTANWWVSPTHFADSLASMFDGEPLWFPLGYLVGYSENPPSLFKTSLLCALQVDSFPSQPTQQPGSQCAAWILRGDEQASAAAVTLDGVRLSLSLCSPLFVYWPPVCKLPSSLQVELGGASLAVASPG